MAERSTLNSPTNGSAQIDARLPSTAGFTKTYDHLREEALDLLEFKADPTSPSSGLLVKKWTSVIRMQKKIMDLDSRLAQALEELSHASTSDGSKRANKEWVPNEPAKYILIGHRDNINAVSFHPLYSVMALASVDATVKIWDTDSVDWRGR